MCCVMCVNRVPIEDFHGGELERLVNEGAKAVDRMVNMARERGEQPKVYIHCTVRIHSPYIHYSVTARCIKTFTEHVSSTCIRLLPPPEADVSLSDN
jgi:hypothetical protein